MKKFLTLLFVSTLLLTGCGKKPTEQPENPSEISPEPEIDENSPLKDKVFSFKNGEVTFYCNGVLDGTELFFETENTAYYFPVQGNYIKKGETLYTVKEALRRELITMDEFLTTVPVEKCPYTKEAK